MENALATPLIPAVARLWSRWALQRGRPAKYRFALGAQWRLALTPADLVLSICVPTYHRPALLAHALRSIGPLPPDVEVLVSDNSVANDLCGRIAYYSLAGQPAGQWRYYRNVPGQNVADNFAACARRARGHYVYHLHDDDMLRPGGLAAMLAELRATRGHYEAILFGVDLVDARHRLIRRQYPAHRQYLPPQEALRRVLTNSSWVRIVSMVASRHAYATYPPDPTQVNSVDTNSWAEFLGRWGVLMVPTCIAAWTVHSGSLTASMFNERSIERILRIFDRTRAQGLLPPRVLERAEAQYFHQFVLAGTWRSLRERDYASARQVMKLFQLPALRRLPLPLRWLPHRLVLTAMARLGR